MSDGGSVSDILHGRFEARCGPLQESTGVRGNREGLVPKIRWDPDVEGQGVKDVHGAVGNAASPTYKRRESGPDARQIAPYVPEEFKGDPMYAEPSAEQPSYAKTAKQSRRAHRAAMAVAAKKSQDRRGRQPADGEPQPPRVKKRKTKETQSAVV
jgi:hypothetical protein